MDRQSNRISCEVQAVRIQEYLSRTRFGLSIDDGKFIKFMEDARFRSYMLRRHHLPHLSRLHQFQVHNQRSQLPVSPLARRLHPVRIVHRFLYLHLHSHHLVLRIRHHLHHQHGCCHCQSQLERNRLLFQHELYRHCLSLELHLHHSNL